MSVLTVTVFIDETNIKSFHMGTSKQAAKFEIRVKTNPRWKMEIIQLYN